MSGKGTSSPLVLKLKTTLSRLGLEVSRSGAAQGSRHWRTLTCLRNAGLDVSLSVDVGAHHGSWSVAVQQLWPLATTLLVEPQRDLATDPRLAGDPTKTVWIHRGAGPADGSAPFYAGARADSASFVRSSLKQVNDVEYVHVQRLDSMLGECAQGKAPQVLKLDCEGWDLEVLSGLGSLSASIDAIFIEAALANPLFKNDIPSTFAAMRSLGFSPVDIYDAARDPKTGTLHNVEVCFINELSIAFPKMSEFNF